MILDLLSHQFQYRSLHPRFAAAFDYLLRFDPKTPEGKYEIAGDDVFAMVQGYVTAAPEERKFETHRERIDIQYVFAGAETMYWGARESMKETEAYDTSKDAAFYANPPSATALVVPAGAFAIFFPQDAHKGSCVCGSPAPVRKIVIKIKV